MSEVLQLLRMPVRAIITCKPAIYSKWRFSCACRAITISLKNPSRDRVFHRFWWVLANSL